MFCGGGSGKHHEPKTKQLIVVVIREGEGWEADNKLSATPVVASTICKRGLPGGISLA